jgi:hypothetical protein
VGNRNMSFADRSSVFLRLIGAGSPSSAVLVSISMTSTTRPSACLSFNSCSDRGTGWYGDVSSSL